MKVTDEHTLQTKLKNANKQLVAQNAERKKREKELIIANRELLYQNSEKEKRAAELLIANAELIFQNAEKEKRAAELAIANTELIYQNKEKEKRAAELVIANAELLFESAEKEKRAAELVIANAELVFQNAEKEKRAAELVIANIELVFEKSEKQKRAAELTLANIELAFQNLEKEKRSAELTTANQNLFSLQNVNKELEAFACIASHDLQEPLRKIQVYTSRILDNVSDTFSDSLKENFERIQAVSKRMEILINDILAFSKLDSADRIFLKTNLKKFIQDLIIDLGESITAKSAIVKLQITGNVNIIPYQFRQLMQNLICNALKFSNPEIPPRIEIKSSTIKYSKENNLTLPAGKTYSRISVTDNGIGFDRQYSEKIFEIFRRFNGRSAYGGTGIGLAIVKKIVENHNGFIVATGELNKGSTFDVYLPLS